MTLRVVAFSICCAVSVACASGGGGVRVAGPAAVPGPDPSTAGEQALQGTWELVGFEVATEGQAVPRRATGQLTFDQFSNISVRAELDPSDPGAAPPRTVFLDFTAKASVIEGRGELAYVGLQRRAPPEQLAPGATDPAEWRHYELSGDTLRLFVQDGGRRAGTLTFRRVSR